MKRPIFILALFVLLPTPDVSASEEMNVQKFSGVVTFHLVPAKVMKINKIIVNPEPGTSHIGEEAILVEVEENPNVMANWTVVDITYYTSHEPKTITYEMPSEQHEITVNYHAVSVEISCDLSSYLKE